MVRDCVDRSVLRSDLAGSDLYVLGVHPAFLAFAGLDVVPFAVLGLIEDRELFVLAVFLDAL